MKQIFILVCTAGFFFGPGVGTAPAGNRSDCNVVKDKVLCKNAVFPGWISWDIPQLPNADIVYNSTDTWDIMVMDEQGGQQRCLTCYNQNILGVNFPLDEDKLPPTVSWKGAPLVHPTEPIIIFTAENEHSQHLALRNTPSMGWDNDIWALNLRSRRYQRLTKLDRREGLQHIAFSPDGRWYVYPLRYKFGKPIKDFGLSKMVFNILSVNTNGEVHFQEISREIPNGEMYYEPHDIIKTGDDTYALLYSAGTGNKLLLYMFQWSYAGGRLTSKNNKQLPQPVEHIEFTMFSPSGQRVAWMGGPQVNLAYRSDLYISLPDLTNVVRATYYNDCKTWPLRCKRQGAQLSSLEWHGNGKAVFFGLWIHKGPLRPARESELHRVDFSGDCGGGTLHP